ncbi:MAG: lysophospholipase [Acidimicrobiia bacterium]|nr:lysophospholipase [Acidimicrobiia bacterium]
MIQSIAVPTTTQAGVGELTRTWTPAEPPRGEVVIVHGLGEHSGRYERTGSILAERGFAVRAFDLIGFGASGGRRAYVEDWTDYLDQVQTHIEAARATGRPVALLGHSMGGAIALDYVLSSRPTPDALVLSAPFLAGAQAWQRALAPVLATVAPRLMIPNGLKGEQLSADPAVGEAYFADPLVQTKTSARLGAEMFTMQDRVNAHLAGLSVPALVMSGGSDTIVPPQSSLPLGSVAERVLYPKLRHELFNEPEGPQVVGEVADWLDVTLTKSG